VPIVDKEKNIHTIFPFLIMQNVKIVIKEKQNDKKRISKISDNEWRTSIV